MRELTLKLAPAGILALVIALPWIVNLLGSYMAEQFFSRSAPPALFGLVRVERPLSYLSSFWLLSFSALSAVVVAFRRRVEFVLLVSWAGISWFFSNPNNVPVPISGLLDTVSWISVTFVFQSVFLGSGLLVVLARSKHRGALHHVLLYGSTAALILAGVFGTGVIPAEEDALVKPEDLVAFAWIDKNLPGDAVLGTNVGISPYTGFVEPADAGVWITYFTGRRQLAPSLVNPLERPSSPEYADQIQELPAHQAKVGSFDSYLYLWSLGVTHLYLGSKDTGPMRAEDVRDSPWYVAVYQEDGVTIAQLKDPNTLDPLVLSGGRDWSFLENGYSIRREWEGNGTVLETYTFEDFRVDYSIYLAGDGNYRLSIHLADFVSVDWETDQTLSGILFELGGNVLLEHQYGSNTIIWLTMELPNPGAGLHTLTVRNRDPGLPFRISLGSVVVTSMSGA